MKDPTSIVLNINRKFDKLNAYTSEGRKVSYTMHNTFDSKLNPRNPVKMLTSLSPR